MAGVSCRRPSSRAPCLAAPAARGELRFSLRHAERAAAGRQFKMLSLATLHVRKAVCAAVTLHCP